MKSDLARKLLADLRECPLLYPYDGADAEPTIPLLLAERVTAVRFDAAAMLLDFRFVRLHGPGGKMNPYTDRETIYHAGRVVGIVAQFGPGDWRLSAAPGSTQYPSREDAVRAAIAAADSPAPTPGATNGN